MRRIRSTTLGALLIASVALAACGSAPGGQPAASAKTDSGGPTRSLGYRLSIQNGTTIRVTLLVNGTVIEMVAPQTLVDPVVADLPALPWQVEARTSSGRELGSMTVRAGDVVRTDLGYGASSSKGDGFRVDLSCGRLVVWSGPPLGGPPPSGPYPSGDCD